jgi:UDP-N-acetylglucosamine--N-acetylmuramyl-(pentapeptide) pyrophosphoryl-undecaprenol N-acetylglucosamine transferase
LPGLLAHCQVLQISGKELYNETRAQADSLLADQDEALRQRYRLVAYLNAEMPLALQAADLVLCRSGASTLTELAALSKPSVLVPLSPAVGGPAQQENAAMFERKQAAIVISNDDLNPDVLVECVLTLIASKAQIAAMAQAASTFAKPDATQDITQELVRIAKRGAVA